MYNTPMTIVFFKKPYPKTKAEANKRAKEALKGAIKA